MASHPPGTVLDELVMWAGITTRPTSRGATAILFEGHELGHVHANHGNGRLSLSWVDPRRCGAAPSITGAHTGAHPLRAVLFWREQAS
jgi:hypothetical protein